MTQPISEKATELLTERIVNRIEEANSLTLQAIGKAIKDISNLTPTKARQLAQLLKYGNKGYKQLVKELATITGKNLRDIEKIFEAVAKKDTLFANQFYQYRNMPVVPYEENQDLKRLVNSMAKRCQKEYLDIANMSETGLASKMIGFSSRDKNNNIIFQGLQDTYYQAIDKAVILTSTGQIDKQTAIRQIIKELGGSGLKKIDYKNGRSIRLDSITRMHMQSSLRDLHNKIQEEFASQYNADGIEISVHGTPAPDHAPVQGRQFSIEQYSLLQQGLEATDYKGNKYTLDHDNKNGYRPISEYNCYHYEFRIVLGVSKPIYSDEELKKIEKEAKNQFDFEGRKFTKYQGTQLQRQIETAIRKEKDLQIMAKAVGDKDEILLHQKNIKELETKYKELCKKGNLTPKAHRLSVSGYHYIPYKDEKPTEPIKKEIVNTNTLEDNIIRITKEEQQRRNLYKIDYYKERVAKYQSDVKYYEKNIELVKKKFNNADYYKKMYGTPEKMASNTYSHYKIAKTNLKDAKEKLKELKALEFKDKKVKLVDYEGCKELLNEIGIKLETRNVDINILIPNTKRLYQIFNKYPWLEKSFFSNNLRLGEFYKNSYTYAHTSRLGYIEYNTKYFKDYATLIKSEEGYINAFWHQMIDINNAKDLTITHEIGHQVEYTLQKKLGRKKMYLNYSNDQLDNIIMDKIYDRALSNLKREGYKDYNKTKLKAKWLSRYGRSKRHYEAFAELFSGYILGDDNPLTEALGEYLDEFE